MSSAGGADRRGDEAFDRARREAEEQLGLDELELDQLRGGAARMRGPTLETPHYHFWME